VAVYQPRTVGPAQRQPGQELDWSLVVDWITAFGVAALTFMMLMYLLESRGRRFVLAFALGCALSSAYGFLSGTWPFGVVEAIWSVIALRRFVTAGSG
jgi:hypothetical protein